MKLFLDSTCNYLLIIYVTDQPPQQESFVQTNIKNNNQLSMSGHYKILDCSNSLKCCSDWLPTEEN